MSRRRLPARRQSRRANVNEGGHGRAPFRLADSPHAERESAADAHGDDETNHAPHTSAPEPADAPAPPTSDYTRDELIAHLLKTIGRKWWERDEAIRLAARRLGYARTGRRIRAAFKSAINGAIRRGLLEYDGTQIRRVKSP